MEYEELLSKTKWEIIKELSKGERSASEIAKKTSQSIANVTQQLKLLEAYNIVKKTKTDAKKTIGKPKTPYKINQEIILTTTIRNGFAEKKAIKTKELDDFHKLTFMILQQLPTEMHFPVMKYVCQADLLIRADTIAYINVTEKEVELFIITEHLHEIRDKHSNMSIACPDGKTKKIISWTHNKKEVEEGVERKEHYFINLIKKSDELLDKKRYLEELKSKIS